MTLWTEQKEQSLFLLCLELPHAARGVLLDAECAGDTALRARVERLLKAYESAEGATLNPLSGLAGNPTTESVGPYRILSVLGEGGMGVVYEAEQQEPLHRVVALKILKPGMDSRRVIRRFRQEQQALATLDHPYIAKVFDAGQTELGRPYFVMERVHGTPLSEFANDHGMRLRPRVALMMRVCEAVQHAHQKGLIHRDLKPSNILVAEFAEESAAFPVPKVIDFGIAKATGPAIDDGQTQLTDLGHALGTIAYMSPEQAALGRLDIDTRADVYSLGVVLYELLCGVLPAEPGNDGYAGFLSALAKGDLAVPRPSDRVAPGGPGAQMHARARGTTPTELCASLRGDLDAIALKAIEPDRERRYQTVAALADDLRRYLEAEPVSARPATAGYRLGRYLRRHRLQVLAVAAVAVALVAGTVASTIGYLRASRAEQAARLEAQAASQVSEFVVNLFTVADPSESRGNTVTAREVLDRGQRTVETDLNGQPALQARFLTTLAGANFSLGLYQRAEAMAAAASAKFAEAGDGDALDAARATLIEAKAQFRRGRRAQAEATARRALHLRRRHLGANHPDVAEVLNELGGIAWMNDRFEEAEQLHRQAMAIYESTGGPRHVGVAASMRGLGIVALSTHRYAESLDWHLKALPLYEEHFGRQHPRIADTYDSIGLALASLKRNGEAIDNMRTSLGLRQKIYGPEHEVLGYSHHNLGRTLARVGKNAEALRHYQEGLAIRERALGGDHPLTALLIESIALMRFQSGDREGAIPLLERSLAVNQKAFGEAHGETMESHRNLFLANLLAKRYSPAISHLRALLIQRPPKELDVDLADKALDPIRNHPGFLRLQADLQKAKPVESALLRPLPPGNQ